MCMQLARGKCGVYASKGNDGVALKAGGVPLVHIFIIPPGFPGGFFSVDF
jgi:hypothetical protein